MTWYSVRNALARIPVRLKRLELRDLFFVGGIAALGVGLALYDHRIALMVVGGLFIYLGVWHK